MLSRLIGGTFVALIVFLWASSAVAAELTVTPVVIDEKSQPRDILKQTITIINTSDRKMNLYPSVNDVNPTEGEEDFVRAQNAGERSASLANWIELSRGVVELGPGEEKVIPFVIRVNLNAVPDAYHAYISFFEGGSREGAELNPPLGQITVNVEVQANIKEELQLNSFFTDTMFFSGDDVLFTYQLENIGNQELVPKGEIRIYDRSGKEVAAVDVNDSGDVISPEQISQLASVWSAAEGLGRYKAFLTVDYGKGQKASVQDTVFFWVVPWQQLAGLIGASLIAVMFLAFYFHRVLEARHHAHVALAVAAATGTPFPVDFAAAQLTHTPRETSHAEESSWLRRVGAPFRWIASFVEGGAAWVRSVREGRRVLEKTPTRAVEERAVKQPLREVLREESGTSNLRAEARHVHRVGATIDLKNVQAQGSPVEKHPHHVINLKNHA